MSCAHCNKLIQRTTPVVCPTCQTSIHPGHIPPFINRRDTKECCKVFFAKSRQEKSDLPPPVGVKRKCSDKPVSPSKNKQFQGTTFEQPTTQDCVSPQTLSTCFFGGQIEGDNMANHNTSDSANHMHVDPATPADIPMPENWDALSTNDRLTAFYRENARRFNNIDKGSERNARAIQKLSSAQEAMRQSQKGETMRSHMVIVNGIPMSVAFEPSVVFGAILSKLELDTLISDVHRYIPFKRDTPSSSTNKLTGFIVIMKCVPAAEDIISKKLLDKIKILACDVLQDDTIDKNIQIYLNRQSSGFTRGLLGRAEAVKRQHNFHSCYMTRFNEVMIRKNANDPPTLITCDEDLEDLI